MPASKQSISRLTYLESVPSNSVSVIFYVVFMLSPVTVAERSKAGTVFARSDAVTVGSNAN
jgi:hypothetical protein